MLYLLITATYLMISQYGMGQPRAVDLGLSVKWASCNLGANAPEEYGDYYAWGETKAKADYSWSTYKWCRGRYDTQTKYNTDSDYGAVDKKIKLEIADDAARANWGGRWRMPTKAEIEELKSKCKWSWTSMGDHKGYKVTGPNGNSIFLPAAGIRDDTDLLGAGSNGYYWSSSLETDSPGGAYSLGFDSGDVDTGYFSRCDGLSVRPVSE